MTTTKRKLALFGPMTTKRRKLQLALAIVAVGVLLPATALANHVFSDVPDGRFYTNAVEWAFDNGITTGKTPTTFEPDSPVTRGENVTFAKRYDDNVVQPALDALGNDVNSNSSDINANSSDISKNASDIAALEAEVALLVNGVAAFAGGDAIVGVDDVAGAVVQSVSLMPPADGIVVVNSSAAGFNTSGGLNLVRCSINEGSSLDFDHLQSAALDTIVLVSELSGTRGYDVSEGVLFTVNLYCDAAFGTADIYDASLTAVFAPS